MTESAQECLRKTSATLRYIPPANPQEPADCKKVAFFRPPEIRIFTGQRSVLEGRPRDELIGIEYLCSVVSSDGVGSIIVLVQVGTYIEWEVGFWSKQNSQVTETHRLFVSMPVMFKIAFTHIMLSRWMPTWMRIGHYAEVIWNGFRKIDEIEESLATISRLQNGICPDDIQTLKASLQKMESVMNQLLRKAAGAAGDEDLARLMIGGGHGTTLFIA